MKMTAKIPDKVVIATRGSDLAKWQSNWIAEKLRTTHPGLEVELRIYKTVGDRNQAASLQVIGGKGAFTKEITDAVLRGEADVAVHSLKDLPTEPVPGLRVWAHPARFDLRDAWIGRDGISYRALEPGSVVATGSLRRRAQALHHHPGIEVEDIRGNVDTRLRKFEDGLMAGYPGQGDYPEGYDPRDRPWYRVCKDRNEPGWSALDIDEGNMGLLLTCTVPMHDATGAFMGVAAVDLTFGHVIDNLLEPRGLDVPVEAFLVDEKGQVVVRSSQKDIARTATDYVPEPFPYTDVLEAMAASSVGHRERDDDGTTTLITWSRLEAMGWTYVIEGEAEALLAAD
jgi:porphobilinogen deaminase